MTRKEILTLAALGVKARIKYRCERIANGEGFNGEMLDEMRSLIEKFDELSEKLESCCSEEE